MGLCNVIDNDVLHGNAVNLAAFLMRMEMTTPYTSSASSRPCGR